MTALQNITANLKASSLRYDEMEGREYVVCPMVMLTEGVHRGSNGPLYYPKGELSKTPAVWNYKPVVVYHPTMNGKPISACDKTPKLFWGESFRVLHKAAQTHHCVLLEHLP